METELHLTTAFVPELDWRTGFGWLHFIDSEIQLNPFIHSVVIHTYRVKCLVFLFDLVGRIERK